MLQLLLRSFIGLAICLAFIPPSFSQTPCDCASAGTCPIAINDNAMTTVELLVDVPGAPDLASCPLESVCLTITHTWTGDISVSLISPNGEHYLLVADQGNNYGECGTQQDNMEICITPGTGNPLTNNTEYACNSAPCSAGTCCLNGNWNVPCGGVTSPITGALQAPNCNLNDFNLPGAPVNGVWTLVLNDACHMDVGTLQNFSLDFACGGSPNALTTNLQAQICEGETYPFNGQSLTAPGVYQMELIASNGCDSIVSLTLDVLPSYSFQTQAGICEGESFGFFGENLTESGDYQVFMTATNGCDSIVSLHLEVKPPYTTTLQAEIVQGSSWNGIPVFSDTTIIEVYTATNGCDSIVTVQILVLSGTRTLAGTQYGLLISPNPFDALASVEVKGFESGKPLTFKLLDLTGRLVQQQEFRSPSIVFSRKSIPSGLYFIKIEEAGRLVALGRIVAK